MFRPLSAAQGGGSSMIVMILVYVVFIAALYFIFFRPQNKRKKQEAQMRNNAQVGDSIVTIGGIVGRIVAVKDDEDAVIIETGSDRSKLKIKRWAIGSVETAQATEESK
ncbi:MAG: preprotein translocase subunit YajC [Clostridia bacterium]|nr:preprotein translocase subunit YajC [Clostridia bacterium]